jgi:dTDP-4-dehydrorhamnose reductase
VVFGYPPAGQKNFGSWLYDSLSKAQPVKLFDDQWVSPSMALNVAQMVGEIATRKLGGIWHTCGATVVNRVEFGLKLCAQFGFSPSLVEPSKMAGLKLLSPRPSKSGLDVRKSSEVLNAKPWTLDEALGRFANEVSGRV